jgi:hypothetical protein
MGCFLFAGSLVFLSAACQQQKVGEARLRVDPTNWEMALIDEPFAIIDQANLLDGLSNFPPTVDGNVELSFDGADLAWSVTSNIGSASTIWPSFPELITCAKVGTVGGYGPAWFGNFTLNGAPLPSVPDLTSPDSDTWVTEDVADLRFFFPPWTLGAEFRFDQTPGPAQERPKIFVELMTLVLNLPTP